MEYNYIHDKRRPKMNAPDLKPDILDMMKDDPKNVSKIVLKVFFNIMRDWNVKNNDQRIILGEPSDSTFYNWRKNQAKSLPRDTLERISYILGMYKSLGILFPTREQADAWVAKPNSAFNNESALQVMLKGNMLNLITVRNYLDAQRG
jgi:hypothetical protein